MTQQILVNAAYPGPAFIADSEPPRCAECGERIAAHSPYPGPLRPTAGELFPSEVPQTSKPRRYRILYVMGGPGSGKGTQCTAGEFGYLYVNPRALLKDEIAAGSETGKAVEEYVRSLTLVPGSIVIRLVVAWIEKRPEGSTILINGFPRTMQQAKDFEEIAGQSSGMLFFNASDQVLEKRSQDVTKYGDLTNIRRRIAEFHTRMVPIINSYRERGQVMEVDAEQDPKVVLEEVRDHLFPDGRAMLSRMTVDRTFRVFHFNVLASTFEKAFPACPEPFREFSYRMPKVCQLIRDSRADIACLVEMDNVDKYGPRIASIGYRYEFFKKPSEKSTDGTAILWRETQGVKLVAGPFFEVYPGEGTSQFALVSRFDIRGHPTVVIATHLKAGRTEEFEAVRLGQVKFLLGLVQKHNEDGTKTVLVLGDFNSCPEGSGYQPLVYPEMQKHMKSAMASLLGQETPITTCKLRNDEVISETIDYIWYNDRATPVRCLGPPSKEELRRVKGLPNKDFPSDHVQLQVDFMFNVE